MCEHALHLLGIGKMNSDIPRAIEEEVKSHHASKNNSVRGVRDSAAQVATEQLVEP